MNNKSKKTTWELWEDFYGHSFFPVDSAVERIRNKLTPGAKKIWECEAGGVADAYQKFNDYFGYGKLSDEDIKEIEELSQSEE